MLSLDVVICGVVSSNVIEVSSVVVSAIVVGERDKYYSDAGDIIDTKYSDPNSMEMSFMQDLDYDKVALIQGNAASFDKQAEQDFFKYKMDYLKEENPTQYEQILKTKTGETGFNGTDTAKKVTRISIFKTKDSNEQNCYQVDCNVYYIDSFSVVSGHNHTVTLSYPVYSKKFYTVNKSPDIYFIYEPFVTSSADNTAAFRYAETDTILVYNDVYSKDSKLYLYKPTWDQLSVKYDRNDMRNSAVDENGKPLYSDRYPTPDDEVFYTKDYRGHLVPVNIEIGWIGDSNQIFGTPVAYNRPLKIYTNIEIEQKFADTTAVGYQQLEDTNNHYKGNFKKYTNPGSGIAENISGLGESVFIDSTVQTVRLYGDPSSPEDPRDDLGSLNDYILSYRDDISTSDRLTASSTSLTRRESLTLRSTISSLTLASS